MKVPAGKYTATLATAEHRSLGEKGYPAIVGQFVITKGDYEGGHVDYTFFLSENSKSYSMEKLAAAGYPDEKIPCEIVVKPKKNSEWTEVAFVNDLNKASSGPRGNDVTPTEKAAFEAEMRAFAKRPAEDFSF